MAFPSVQKILGWVDNRYVVIDFDNLNGCKTRIKKSITKSRIICRNTGQRIFPFGPIKDDNKLSYTCSEHLMKSSYSEMINRRQVKQEIVS
jgi:hypothetical protein